MVNAGAATLGLSGFIQRRDKTMSKTIVSVKNMSTVLTDGEIQKALPAFQKQVTSDFAASEWGIGADLHFVGKGSKVPAGSWLLGVFDDADQAGALCYHDLSRSGLPLGKVFAKTTMDDGGVKEDWREKTASAVCSGAR